MGSLSLWHWLVVLLIVMMIFGTKKLRNMGADLGGAVKGFKEGMREDNASAGNTPQVGGRTIDAESKQESNTRV